MLFSRVLRYFFLALLAKNFYRFEQFMKHKFVLLPIVALALSSCGVQTQQGQQTQMQQTALGTLGGAALGVATSAITGGNVGKGAIAGGVVGGALGLMNGTQQAKQDEYRQAEYNERQEQLSHMERKFAQQEAQNRKLQREINQLKKKQY